MYNKIKLTMQILKHYNKYFVDKINDPLGQEYLTIQTNKTI
jgi:hypothetical protein